MVTEAVLDQLPLKLKFLTAAFSYEVDSFFDERMEKLQNEDLRIERHIMGTPTIDISPTGQVLIAVPYKEFKLNNEQTVSRIKHMDEKEVQTFENWQKVVVELQEAGYTFRTE